jgi:hypothetical protein
LALVIKALSSLVASYKYTLMKPVIITGRRCGDNRNGPNVTEPMEARVFQRKTIVMALAMAGAVMPTAVRADGCTVLLCLSNPAGWAAVSQCVPPVRAVWKDLMKGRMPVCAYSDGAGGTANARMTYVEDGTTLGPDGEEVPRMVRAVRFVDGTGKVQVVKILDESGRSVGGMF